MAWSNDGFTVTRYPYENVATCLPPLTYVHFSEGGESSVPLHTRPMHPMLLVGSLNDELAYVIFGTSLKSIPDAVHRRWRDTRARTDAEVKAAKAAYTAAHQKYNAARHDEDVLKVCSVPRVIVVVYVDSF